MIYIPENGATGKWFFARATADEQFMSRFVKRKQYIGQLELLAAVAVYYSVPQWFRQRAVIHYVDNSSAVAALVKGYSSRPDSAKILYAFWAMVAGLGALPWFYYVRSEANVGDFPSRDKEIEYLVSELQAVEIEFVMPPFDMWASVEAALEFIERIPKHDEQSTMSVPRSAVGADCLPIGMCTEDDMLSCVEYLVVRLTTQGS